VIVGLVLGDDSFPHLPPMDGDAGIDLEAQPHASVSDLEHRDFEQTLKTSRVSDGDRLLNFSR
jgi:hypothetical protein